MDAVGHHLLATGLGFGCGPGELFGQAVGAGAGVLDHLVGGADRFGLAVVGVGQHLFGFTAEALGFVELVLDRGRALVDGAKDAARDLAAEDNEEQDNGDGDPEGADVPDMAVEREILHGAVRSGRFGV